MSHARSSLALALICLLAAAFADTGPSNGCPFANAQRGHNKPFGHHSRQWQRVENRFDAITAEEFYAEYVRPSKPVVVRGGIADWPAVHKWPNLTYLSELGGDTLFQVDWRRIYDMDRAHATHAMRRELTMKDYIFRMGKENVYMDTPLTKEMFEDMMWPQVTNCEYFIKRMRAPSFFFNDGKSNTDIHIDGTETLFFQISGRRLWLMTPPENARYMYSGEEYFKPHSGISVVDQNKVDLKEYPNIAKSTIYATMVYPGDLVYVPEAWFHNVMARGNPNMATTIFFDSSNCEKIFASENDASFVVSCDKHRSIFLPHMIECTNKMSKGSTFQDVANKYGEENEKLLPKFNTKRSPKRQKMMDQFFHKPFWRPKVKGFPLPRMALNADIASLLDSFKNKSASIMEMRYSLFHLMQEDIQPLAQHLLHFGVPREEIQVMLTVPHDVSGNGAEAVTAWLSESVKRFGSLEIGSLDVVLLEAPPCIPDTAMAQDCSRDSAVDELRLQAWAALVAWQQEGRIRVLGVKDVSAAELGRLHAAHPDSVGIVSLRLDPLYRQMKLRRAATKLGARVMAHSTDGSGWVRDGLAKENPIYANEPVLMLAYSDSRSVYAVLYEWAIRRGYLLLPERVTKPERADIELDIMHSLTDSNSWRATEDVMDQLVKEDRDYGFFGKKRRKN